MPISNLLIGMPNYRGYSNIQPFTVRDGATYLLQLEALKDWWRDVVVPHIDSEVAELADSWEEQTTELVTAFENALAAITAYIDAAKIDIELDKDAAEAAKIAAEAAAELAAQYASDAEAIQDVAVTGIFNNIASNLREAIDAVYLSKSDFDAFQGGVNSRIEELEKKVTRVVPKLVGNGTADDAAIINAAIAAASGSNLVVEIPAGTWYLKSPISNVVGGVAKSIDFKADGANFIKDSAGDSVFLTSGYSAPSNVESVTPGRLTESNGNSIVDIVTLILTSPLPDLVRGDVVKVVSDDVNVLGDGRNDPVIKPYCGQYFSVVSASGNVVVVAGEMQFPFATNIRVAQLKNVRSSWSGGVFTVSQAHIDNALVGNTFNVNSALDTTIERVRIGRGTSAGVSVTGSYRTSIDNIRVGWLRNEPSSEVRAYGYGVSDSSQGTTLTNSYFNQVRHAYTTGGAYHTANNVRLDYYGNVYQARISNCWAEACTSSGWDTHEGALDVVFDNVHVTSCTFGFGMRGCEVRLLNVTSRNCDTGIRLFDAGYSTEVLGTVVDGYVSRDDALGIETFFGGREGALNYQVQQTRLTTFRNIMIRTQGRAAVLTWGQYLVENFVVEVYGSNPAGYVFTTDNSRLFGSNLTFNINLAGGAHSAIMEIRPATGSTETILKDILVRGDVNRINKMFKNPTNWAARVSGIMLPGALPGGMHDAFSVGAFVDWETGGLASAGENVSLVTNTGDIVFTTRKDILAKFTLTSARTYSNFGNPSVIGQRLLIMNAKTSTANLTILASTARLEIPSDVTIAPGNTLELISSASGLWSKA